ncbi:MAG: metallopeptidase family protein [Actinomycetota bacterium]|nr:metallopeptidase family protein [Actinomycetota bacterium]
MSDHQDPDRFRALVGEAIDSLPDDFAKLLDNVEVVVEDEPPIEMRRRLAPHGTLLGLYHGIPLPKRGGNYTNVLPDKISIYRGPIERMSRDADEVREQVRRTVLHEIAHYFGIDDDRLDELGY